MNRKDLKINKKQAFMASTSYMMKFSRDIYLPSLPAIALALDASNNMIQYSIPVYFIAIVLSRFFWTPLSDVYGVRRILLICIPLFIVGSLLCCFAVDVNMFILGRSLQAFGVGCLAAIGRTILLKKDRPEKTTKSLAIVGLISVWAPALATMIGGLLQHFVSWRANFIFLLILGILYYVFCYITLEPHHKRRLASSYLVMASMMKKYFLLLKNKVMFCYVFSFSLIASGTIAYLAASPIYFIHVLKVPAYIYGFSTFFTMGGMLIGQLIAGMIVKKRGIDRTLIIGSLVSMIASLLLIASYLFVPINVYSILIPGAIFFIGMGIMAPTTKAVAMVVVPNTVGAASAYIGAIQGVFTSITTAVIAYLPEAHLLPLGLLLLVLSILSLVIMLYKFFIIGER